MARKYLDTTGLTALWAKIKGFFVKRSGDIMTGALVAPAFTASATGSPTINSQSTDVDASKADNNVSSDHYPAWMASDKYSRILTRMECVASSNGNIAAYWCVRNYNTSGSQVAQKGIKMSMDKGGNISYTIDENGKFRTALGLATVASSGDYNDLTNKPDTNIYNNYSNAVQYNIGNVVYYGGFVYKCIVTPPSPGYSPTGSPQYWTVTNISAQIGDVQRCMSIRETFPANTSIVTAISSIITKYGKNSMMGGFIITGYGFVHFSLSFSDDGQGGGYVVANNKGTGGNTPALYIIQYVNGVVTLGYT